LIKKINVGDRRVAEDVLKVQIPSYQVEAEIIGYYDIPPLRDTVETIQQCDELFFGYYTDTELCGFISVKIEKNEADIHRLVVHPKHFRKGIAQSLLEFIEGLDGIKTLKVSTGSKNSPAVSFYIKNGFQPIKEVRIDEKLVITLFEK
jgi:ribosomal protein S18 acetylase RimI-like enzyme